MPAAVVEDPGGTLRARVVCVREVATGIYSYELVSSDGSLLPSFSAGAHVDVHLANGLVRQYSLCNSQAERHRYVLGVLREPASRGGSTFMHDHVHVGTELSISPPRNNFPLASSARRSILLAGGIGMTPLLSMAHALADEHQQFELHMCARAPDLVPFEDELRNGRFSDRVHFYFDGGDPSKGLDVAALLASPGRGEHVYCCGPTGFMEAVEKATADWPDGTVHFEYFKADVADTTDDAEFEVVLHRSGRTLPVPADRTILEVLLAEGVSVPSSCQEGTCGTCLTGVVSGEPDHRDVVLTRSERAENALITVCCSRSRSAQLVLDL